MCVAASGEIVGVSGQTAKVNILGNIVEADNALANAKPGDHVLVHAGFVLEVVKRELADELRALFEELGELEDEDA